VIIFTQADNNRPCLGYANDGAWDVELNETRPSANKQTVMATVESLSTTLVFNG
jgi:hypothetical protein